MALLMTKADIVRRLEDCLVVFDRVVHPVEGDLARAKLIALLLDVSEAEVAERPDDWQPFVGERS